jgi:hypothetical protein
VFCSRGFGWHYPGSGQSVPARRKYLPGVRRLSDPATPAAADALTKQLAAGEDLYRRLSATIAQHFMKGHRFVHDLFRVGEKAPPRCKQRGYRFAISPRASTFLGPP